MNRNSHQSVKKQAYDFNVFLKAGVRRPWATGDATQQRLGGTVLELEPEPRAARRSCRGRRGAGSGASGGAFQIVN